MADKTDARHGFGTINPFYGEYSRAAEPRRRLSVLRSTLLALAAASAIAVSAVSGALGDDLQTTQASQPVKFCLFRFGMGLTNDEKHIIATMLVKADGSQNSRTEIFHRYNAMCTGAEYQVMTSCISFAPDLKACLVLISQGGFDGEHDNNRQPSSHPG